MKKRTIITTEKREVWVIHQAIERDPNPQAATDILNGVLSLPTESGNVEEPTPAEEVENEE